MMQNLNQNNKKYYSKKLYLSAFTLVELIVVIVILAILATIAFLSFNSYSSSSRDSVRLSDVNSIKKSLELYNVTGGAGYPIPDSYTGVTFSGGILWYQGFLGNQVTEILGTNLSKKPIDPLFNNEYTYSLLGNKREYQIKANLESGKMGYNDIDSDSLAGNFDFNISKEAKAASNSGTTCYINGNFNGLVGNTKDSSLTNYILAIPSIILTDPTSSVNTTFTGGNLSKMGSGILQCNGQSSPCIVTYNSSNIIYTGIPTTTSQAIIIAQNLQQAYSGSNITNLPIISNLLSASGQALTDLGIGIISKSAGVGNLTTPNSSNILLLHFDGNFNNYGLFNSSITNNGGVNFVGGKFGQAANFNGSNYLTFSNSDYLDIGNNDFTFDFWFTTTSTVQDYLFARTTGNYIDYGMDVNRGAAGKIRFLASDSNDNNYQILVESSIAVNDGNWHHIAAVRKDDIFYLFIDGVNRGTDNTATCNINDSNQPFSIGKDLYLPEQNRFITGKIDEFSFSNGLAKRTSNFTPPNLPY